MLTLVGAIMLAIYGFVMMRLPILGFLLSRLGIVSLWVDPVGAPICAAGFLTVGMLLLLRRKAKPTDSISR